MPEATPTATPALVLCADTTIPLTTTRYAITHPPIILGPAVPTMSIALTVVSISVREQATAPPTRNGPDAIGTNIAATAMNCWIMVQAMAPTLTERGNTTTRLAIVVTIPVMTAEKAPIPMDITLQPPPTRSTALPSISMANTVPPAEAMLVQLPTAITPTPTAHGRTTPALSTEEQRLVRCAATAPMNMQAILCPMAAGLPIVRPSTSGQSAVPAVTVQLNTLLIR